MHLPADFLSFPLWLARTIHRTCMHTVASHTPPFALYSSYPTPYTHRMTFTGLFCLAGWLAGPLIYPYTHTYARAHKSQFLN